MTFIAKTPPLLCAALCACATASASGLAAPDAYGDSIVNLREISVTATKQAVDESAATGMTTVIGRADVERLRIVTAKDAANKTPNLFIPDYGSRVTSTIYARGLGARIDQPAVGMTIDNVPLLSKDNYDFDILDIETVQVLRGPQSTLYGRNTMGGVIDVRTLSPMSYQGTRVMAEYGNANTLSAGLSHYARPSRSFGVGATAHYYRTDGFFENQSNGENCDKERYGRVSLKLAWKPSDRLLVENMASVSAVRQGGYPYEFADTREISYNDTCFYRRTSVIDGLTVKWKTPAGVDVTSVTSYQFIDDNMTLDQDFLPLSYFTLTQTKREHAVTQDVMAKGEAAGGKVSWIGGAFGFYRDNSSQAPVTFKDYGIDNLITSRWNTMNPQYPISWDSDSFLLDSSFEMPSFGLAAYGEGSLKLGRLTAVAGLRLDYESTRLRYQSDCSTSYTILHVTDGGQTEVYDTRAVEIHANGSLRRHFTQLLPKVAVAYEIPSRRARASVYLSAAKGYKAGGFNTQMFSDVLQQQLMSMMGIGARYDVDRVVGYKPEKSWNFEAGAHIATADGRLTASAAAFYIDCRDQQLTVFPDGDVTGRIMANAGKTRSFGFEASVAYCPAERLSLSAGYGYTNAKFLSFDNGKTDYSGNFIPYAPQNTIFAAANYTLKISRGPLRYVAIGASAAGAGKIYWNEENSLCQPFYVKLDTSVKLICDHFSIDLWTKNLTGTQYSTFYFVSIQHEFLQSGKPRQYGATLRITI